MTKIYKDQFFRLTVSTGVDLTDATVIKIKYTAPDKTTGEWNAAISDIDNTKAYYDCSGLNQIGTWFIYVKATFTQGNIPGDLTNFIVYEEGK